MKHPIPRLAIIVSAALAIIGFGTGFEAAEQDEEVTYKVRPLSSLGGTSSRGNGVNDAGFVTGFSNLTENKARRASVWFHDQVFQLDPLGGTNSSVAWSGKNNSGLVVGITQTSQLQARTDGWSCRVFFPGPDNTKYTCVGFVWEGGRMTALPTLGGDNGFATSANNQHDLIPVSPGSVQCSGISVERRRWSYHPTRTTARGRRPRSATADTWSASPETATSRSDAGPRDTPCCGRTGR